MTISATFQAFTNGQPEMDGRQFAKLCKDCKIIDAKFTATDADLMFAKVKAKGARKISIAELESALEFIAQKKGCSVDAVRSKVENNEGPVLQGTKADAVRFHDDKSLYTGVYANGGPSTVDAGRSCLTDLSQFADRSGANVRGVKHGM
eukprot:GDKI01002338.1.p2 GENE.GDKI01002338.1~~GDKI01002338.1.p2  ORF type:complete len:149 (+),score=56.58 GDKI01002338.1:151-597(+)